jgi:hypothetical protein
MAIPWSRAILSASEEPMPTVFQPLVAIRLKYCYSVVTIVE